MNTVAKVKVWHFAIELFDLCAGIFVYAVLLVSYLRIVGKKFVKKEYQLQTYENIFLLLPCIIALSIAITLKIMLTNTETETTVTAYEKILAVKKSQQAAKNQISFETDFTYPINQQIDAYDIGIILNNALENTSEACAKAEGKKETKTTS